MFLVLTSWQSHCESSLGSGDKCRTAHKRQPTCDIAHTMHRPIKCLCHVCQFFSVGFTATLTFLPRDALVHSAVLRLHVVRLSVCL